MSKVSRDKTKTSTKSRRLQDINKKHRRRLSAYNKGFALKVKEVDTRFPRMPCLRMEGMDLSGVSTTDSFGVMVWRLSEFLCYGEKVPPIELPINFVATPFTRDPVYITALGDATELPFDLFFQVFSWDKNGEPAPDIPFYWRCMLPIRKIN